MKNMSAVVTPRFPPEQRHRGPRIRFGPSGMHVFDRRSGFNVLFDEVQPPKEVWAAAPRQVSIALTNACDLACPHCYAPKDHGALKFETLVAWLDELDSN